ncbi:F420-dependent methylene-tetrahydromethanopterin reductase [Streptomyces diastatochromogenes]|uniref:F420-dependent methylene-tetrahydromethanopterin reductase n=1 Tax=Streptomyces diastatochromogenes TaxID=42236 RepID=A0A233SL27_STRDA|nr:F420-dependent methylene-tetrahydromethanopterin reductase [Streptomyces diastatochromogenes]
MRLAVCLPGDGDTAARPDQPSGSPIALASFEQPARTAERGLFDFVLLSEGPRRIDDLDATGRPEPLTVLNALAGVTERLGLAATVPTALTEPYELARRLATLDHLSGGRAAWHVATSADTFTGADLRHDGSADRYGRAAEFVAVARRLWTSWSADGVSRPFAHQGRHFDIAGEFGLPRSPQGHPVVIRAGDSDQDRESAAATADVLLTRHRPPAAGRSVRADVTRRLAAYGRAPEDLKVLAGVTVVLGDTAAEAQERAVEIRRQRITPQRAPQLLGQAWGVDLSGHDPDGPLPETDPVPGPGTAEHRTRRLTLEASGRPAVVGTPETVAAELEAYVREDAADGFVLVPHHTPGGLDEFVDRVVPLLQERGAFRTEYQGATLRSHLGLPDPPWEG